MKSHPILKQPLHLQSEQADKKEEVFFLDILSKLTNLNKEKQIVVNIGSGFTSLTAMLIEFCQQRWHRLILVDTPANLDEFPSSPLIKKITVTHQSECNDIIKDHINRVDVILSYGIFHHIMQDNNMDEFIDNMLRLLATNGQFLLGHLPNSSKRQRYVDSRQMPTTSLQSKTTSMAKEQLLNALQLDDGRLASLVMNVRASGFNAYLMPQREGSSKAYHREDILITKP